MPSTNKTKALNQISMHVLIYTADTWQLTILQKSQNYILYLADIFKNKRIWSMLSVSLSCHQNLLGQQLDDWVNGTDHWLTYTQENRQNISYPSLSLLFLSLSLSKTHRP